MDEDEAEFLLALKNDFIVEAHEHLDDCESVLLKMEEGVDEGVIEKYKRLLHSIKGSAQATDFTDMSKAVHSLESMIGNIPNDKMKDFIQIQLSIVDELRNYLQSLKSQENVSFLDKVHEMLKKI